jgi:hypothetical protein
MPNVPYPYEVNWQIGHRKWFLNTNLFLIKQFLIAKFDCSRQLGRFATRGFKNFSILLQETLDVTNLTVQSSDDCLMFQLIWKILGYI